MAKEIPRRFKRLEETDYMKVNDLNGDVLVVTKQETRSVIKEMLEYEYELLSRRAIQNVNVRLTEFIDEKFNLFQKDAEAFINHKIDQMAEKICNALITRKFNEEVEKKAEELLLKKQYNIKK
jgi:hypothetical protein